MALAIPLPCSVYRKRKPMVLGEEMYPKFTQAFPGPAPGQVPASTFIVIREIQDPVPSTSHSRLGAGSIWNNDRPPRREQTWKVTEPRSAGDWKLSSTCALRTNSSPTNRVDSGIGWLLCVRNESS